MKNIISIFLISCFSLSIISCAKRDGSSDTTIWSGTKQIVTSTYDYGTGVTLESSDIFIASGQTNIELDGNTNSGSDDIFLVKYNSSGTKRWAEQLGISDNESGISLAVDSFDNIYVTGFTNRVLDGNINLGGEDIVLMKYNSFGTKQWTKQLGLSASDFALDVTVDSSDNIHVIGFTNSIFDENFDHLSDDIILVKYNSDGVKQ